VFPVFFYHVGLPIHIFFISSSISWKKWEGPLEGLVGCYWTSSTEGGTQTTPTSQHAAFTNSLHFSQGALSLLWSNHTRWRTTGT